MFDPILKFIMRQRLLVVLGGLILFGAGVVAWKRLPIDAYPDVTNVQVMILTDAPGLTPGEVERLVSFPIEIEMAGLPDVRQVRSLSKSGLSQVVIIFEDDVDTYFARQLVFERLAQAREKIPEGLEPELGPISTGLGEIYQYTLESGFYCDEHPREFSKSGGTCRQCGEVLRKADHSNMDLRTVQDWLVAPQLRRLPGINEVNSFGGFVKQFHVIPDPEALLRYGLCLRDVLEALEANNANAGGGFIVKDWEQSYLLSRGLLRDEEDIKRIVLEAENGTPVFLRDVAEVKIGGQTRLGAVTKDGKGEAVIGMAIMLKGSNSKTVVDRVKTEVPEIRKSLPPGVNIEPFYDRTSLIQACINTVGGALSQGAVFVVLVLFFFLWDFRAALTVAISIPITAATAFVLMESVDVTANLMSLGGLAIALGMIVDGSIVVTENIVRHMRTKLELGHSRSQVAYEALSEVARPVAFAILIIVIVFIPLFTLESLEGKMFKPLALTICFAMVGSFIASLTVVPVIASLIAGRKSLKSGRSALAILIDRAYTPFLELAFRGRWITIAIAAAIMVGSLSVMPRLGTEFLPSLNEGAIAINVVRLPSASLEGSAKQATEIEGRLLERFPEVTTVVSKTGRAEIAEDPMGPEQNDIFVMLKPESEWTTGRTRQALVEEISAVIADVPGIRPAFSQPIALRVNELISGIKSDLAIKIFGDDLDTLRQTAERVAPVLAEIRGAEDVKIEQVSGLSQIEVRLNREAMARHRINAREINELVEIAFGGKVVTTLYEGQKQFAVLVRFPEKRRNGIAALERTLVRAPGDYSVQLGQLVDIVEVEAPAQISREDSRRRVIVECNVRGRDIGGFVGEAKARLAGIEAGLPQGYRFVWGGEFENQQRAMARLSLVVPITILLIFLMLYGALGSLKSAVLILLNLPFALVGGVLTIYFLDINLSVPAFIGFIALLGVAVENGLVLVSFFDQLRREGKDVKEAVLAACHLRVRPLLMTTMTTLLGLLPLLYATGPGSEIQKPLVAVIFGGLITSLALTLVVLPVIYALVNGLPAEEEVPQGITAASTAGGKTALVE